MHPLPANPAGFWVSHTSDQTARRPWCLSCCQNLDSPAAGDGGTSRDGGPRRISDTQPAQPGNTTKETAMHPTRRSPNRTDPARRPETGAAAEPGPALGTAGLSHRRHLEKTVSWTGPERLRCLWYRLRLTVAEMNYATRRTVELQAPWITGDRPR